MRSALVFFALSFVGIVVAGALLFDGMPASHWIYLVVRCGSLFMLSAGIVNVTSLFLFSIALRAVRLEPPHIAQDLIVALVYLAIAIALLSQSGVDLRGIVATSAVITAVIGFSLQDSLGNIIGGMFVLNNFTAQNYDTNIRATGTGMQLGIGRAGGVLGPYIFGIISAFYSIGNVFFYVIAIVAMVMAGLILFAGSELKHRAENV